MFRTAGDLDKAISTFTTSVPEILLVIVIVVVILISFSRKLRNGARWVSLAGAVIHPFITGYVLIMSTPETDIYMSGGHGPIVTAFFFQTVASIAAILTILMSRHQKMEYYVLVLSILLGADIMAGTTNFIMILLGMELISIPSYILTAGTGSGKVRAEAAWKFFLYGSTATATMIFGMSYLYGASGVAALTGDFQGGDHVMLLVGGLLMLAGLFFKMAAAPFHLWAPDVYEAAPAPVVAYLSVVPKLAGLAVVITFVDSFRALPIDWTMVIAAFAILSILVGTLAALAQKDAKRMMAYSTVAQAGFLLTAIASYDFASADAIYAVCFYGLVFLIMNYTVFAVIQAREESGGSVLFEDFSGLGSTYALPAVATTIAFVSLTGLPPVAGFTAKLLVFSTLWTRIQTAGSLIFIALFVVGLLATVASLFFYLRIPYFMFFRESIQKEPLKIGPVTNFLLLFSVGLLLALFFSPSLFDWLGGWVIKVNFVL